MLSCALPYLKARPLGVDLDVTFRGGATLSGGESESAGMSDENRQRLRASLWMLLDVVDRVIEVVDEAR